jgi:hypothetical protein
MGEPLEVRIFKPTSISARVREARRSSYRACRSQETVTPPGITEDQDILASRALDRGLLMQMGYRYLLAYVS